MKAQPPKPAQLRCAIYTRKSSEEGLEHGFNSLHAQREACEAYVLSQAGEGWTALATHYDDGGWSGGNMERVGLQQLLADIAAHKIDVVVVYKIDRLTRALADFAKIVEQFDGKGVSFVSVTQAFNTTSSMGRLAAEHGLKQTGGDLRDASAPLTKYNRRLCSLAFLAPDIQRAILEGLQPAALKLTALMAGGLPLAWIEQRRVFGFS